jgi:hypothetical protein
MGKVGPANGDAPGARAIRLARGDFPEFREAVDFYPFG